MSNKRTSFSDFKEKALADSKVKAEYDALSPSFELKRQMIAMRKKAGLTQEQMAERLGTKKSNISRLESINSDVSPRFATIEAYASALGYKLEIGFQSSSHN